LGNGETTRVLDLRGLLSRGTPNHQFTGIYCAEPELFGLIPPGEVVSAVFAFAELAKQGRLGCVVLDEGVWLDLGDPETLLDAHLHPPVDPESPSIHPEAEIETGASVDGETWVGPGAVVPAGAELHRCLVFPGTRVEAGRFEAEILFGGV
jgi:mannose-1-phosphate guanylyltransferase